MQCDLARYQRATRDHADVDLLDDITGLHDHHQVDAGAPRALLARDIAEQPTDAADHLLTADPGSWRRVMAGVRARLAADVLDLEHAARHDDDPWAATGGASAAVADAHALDAPLPPGSLRAAPHAS